MLKLVDAIIPSMTELSCYHETTLQERGNTLSSKNHNDLQNNLVIIMPTSGRGLAECFSLMWRSSYNIGSPLWVCKDKIDNNNDNYNTIVDK